MVGPWSQRIRLALEYGVCISITYESLVSSLHLKWHQQELELDNLNLEPYIQTTPHSLHAENL